MAISRGRCEIGTKNATQTVQNTVPDWLTSAYKDIISKGQNLTNTNTYHPYTGGFTADQQTAFGNIGALAGSSNGDFQQANAAIHNGLTPSYQTVGQYMNPYVSNVVNATMANMNEMNGQQQQQVIGNAAAKGALGGNRVGVAQAELARQQDLANQQTIAGLWNGAYNTALGANQQQQQLDLSGAAGLADLGQTQMNTGLAQAGAQLGAGTQQQQFNYQQYQNQQGFPYQNLAYLASLINGTGPNAGGTTTTTQPYGNSLSQLFGLGLGIAGLFKDGGVVRPRYANGGVMPYVGGSTGAQYPSYLGTGSMPYGGDGGIFVSYIPQIKEDNHRPNFPGTSDYKGPDDKSDSAFGSPSPMMQKGAGNIKDWISALFGGANPTGLADGGVVPRHLAGGGNSGPEMMGSWSPSDFYSGNMAPPTSSGGMITPTPTPTSSIFGPSTDYSSFYGNPAGSAAGTAIQTISGGGYANGSIDPNKDQSRLFSPAPASPYGNVDPVIPGDMGTGFSWLRFPGVYSSGSAFGVGGLLPPGPPTLATGDPWQHMRIGNPNAVPNNPGMRTGTPGRVGPPPPPQNNVIGRLSSGAPLYSRSSTSATPWINAPNDAAAAQIHSGLMAQQTDPTSGQVAMNGQISRGGTNIVSSSTGFRSRAQLAAEQAAPDGQPIGQPKITPTPTPLAKNRGGRIGFASGGVPSVWEPSPSTPDEVASLYDGLIDPNGGITGGALIPPVPLAPPKSSASRSVAPITDSYSPEPAPRATATPSADSGAGAFDYTPFSASDIGNTNSGVVPYTHGDQFMTQPDPKYSSNIGDAWKSLTSGKGLNLAPDVRQALIAAGAGMMSSRSPFALQGIGEGALTGMDVWFKRQQTERDNAKERAAIAQNGQMLATNAAATQANVGLTQAQAGGARYSFKPTPVGVMVTDNMNPGNIQFYPIGSILPTGDQVTKQMTSSPGDGGGKVFRTDPPKGGSYDPRMFSETTAPIATGEATQGLTDARKQYSAATAANQQLLDLQSSIDTLAVGGGWLTPGAGFDQRLEAAKGLNAALQIAGLQPIVPVDMIAAGEDANKVSTRLGYNLTQTLGQGEAAQIVNSSINATPGAYNSKAGADKLISTIRMMNQRQIDYYTFLQQWSADPNHAGSILGADQAFNQMNPPELYALAAVVPQQALLTLRQHPELADQFNQKYGNGRDVARYVIGSGG